ncbi:MAG: phosphotriesterase [Subtercola sp.]|jgi:phosphotriesterase-related protein|nr:phosphotriesterase [Subtercola sp.]
MTTSVMTVTGPVSPADIGPTLMHEHVFVDLTCNFVLPSGVVSRRFADKPVDLEMLSSLRRRPFSVSRDNLILDDERLAAEELRHFFAAGGRTIVDCTVTGIGRDALPLRRMSIETGLNIVLGTGFYVEPAHPDWIESASVESITELFINDIRSGVDGTDVRAGIIGEIGVSGVSKSSSDYARDGYITPSEEKVLRAAGAASVETGAAVSLHLDVRGESGEKIIDILESEGTEPGRIVAGHLDALPNLEYHRRLADRGVFVEYDAFGREYYSEELGKTFGSDERRMHLLRGMIDAGYLDRLVISSDISMKMDLRAYGGSGYAHLLVDGPSLFETAGISESDMYRIMVQNPQSVLAFDAD